MSRVTCYRCFWPQSLCWCGRVQPMPTSTRFVFLMHPKEWKQEKAGTGRLTHLCLPNSEIIMGIGFDGDERVNELVDDPRNHSVLLYPGLEAKNLSTGDLTPADFSGKTLVVFLLDATWACARKMLRLSTRLQRLPRIMFTPTAPSRFVIKQQPQEGCLSTLEATHELLLALEKGGLDTYSHPKQLLDLFKAMQDYQIACASDPNRGGYRRKAYSAPEERKTTPDSASAKRNRFLKTTGAASASPADVTPPRETPS